MIKYLGILFIWMKWQHIRKNNSLYTRNIERINKYWFFYVLKLLYPLWIIGGLFTGNIIYIILLAISLIKYLIYPLLKGISYAKYELVETLVSIILYIILLFS